LSEGIIKVEVVKASAGGLQMEKNSDLARNGGSYCLLGSGIPNCKWEKAVSNYSEFWPTETNSFAQDKHFTYWTSILPL